ncbi:SgcJ/EcaC family oxidoreductase [Sphingomonas mesophila]|uniref:SgcJ/EcaC family oxidoreductase n=1 Tax=Sphingomonas mesophila TaxID=2303576 RepID=UPI001967247F|nr:SgcJ/EcaC family oxidoreductase [Sphingomonas mesophila]
MLTSLLLAAAAAQAGHSGHHAGHHAGHDMGKAHAMQCAAVPANAADALFERFNSAWATKNPDTVTDLFAKDAVLLATVSNTPRTTRAAIRDYFVGFLKNSPVGTVDSSTVKVGCNSVARMGTWTVLLTNPETGAKTPVKARYTFLYVPEGKEWKIAHLHSSMMPETAGK